MSTRVWPPIAPDELKKREEESLARELEWLLSSFRETFTSLKAGLNECAALLSPDNGPTTLAMSSHRSESLKGFLSRVGTRIVKGDVHVRLATLPPPRNSSSHSTKLSVSTEPSATTLVLSQIINVRTLINTCLDIIDVSTWTGGEKNADFISGQLRLLFENIQEAKGTLKGGPQSSGYKDWFEEPTEQDIFDPPLPNNVSFHLTIAEAALVLHIRTLQVVNNGGGARTPQRPSTPGGTNTPKPSGATSGGGGGSTLAVPESFTGYNLRERLAAAVGAGSRPPSHDEASGTYTWRDGAEVRVREKVRVESQDPSLLSAMAKLSALEHSVAMSRRALATVMGSEE